MAWRQLLPGRRWCRLRSFLVLLALAACLFYQTLTPLRTRKYLSAFGNRVPPNPGAEVWHGMYQNISARQIPCLLPSRNLQEQKEIENAIFKYFRNQTRAVTLYIPSSSNKQDLLSYRRILAQHGYAVTVLENRKINGHEIPSQDKLHSWDLFICLSSSKSDHENCLKTVELHQTRLLQKTNILPQIQHLLSRKEGFCQIVRTFPDLHLPIVLPACQESSFLPFHTEKSLNKNERTSLTHMFYQPIKNVQHHQKPIKIDNKEDFNIQDFSIIIKVYVLVTSLTPLRAFIHSTGVVWYAPKKKLFSVKLQNFFEAILGASSPQQALEDMKEAITKLLLITEVFTEVSSSGPNASGPCTSCFQMLTFDIGLSRSMQPVVLEVHEHFDFQAGAGSSLQDQSVKESLLEDTFRILLSNQTSSTFSEALQNVYQLARIKDEPHQKELDHCLTLEQLNPIICFIQELRNLGQFELLFPSTVPKIRFLLHDLYHTLDPRGNLSSVLTLHQLISDLLEQLEAINKDTHVKQPGLSSDSEQGRTEAKPSSPNSENHKDLHYLKLAKETPCSHDKDTLPHIRQIFTSPHLELNPYFDTKIKEYYSEVPFDVLTINIRAEAVNCRCEIHLDEKKGPSVANYPLGLGINRINILVTDESQLLHEVVSIYKIIIYREERPSLPLFDDFMVCGFVQDCGSIIHPKESCGLQPLSAEYLSMISHPQMKTCEMGDIKGQWIVPCLSCSDNRTCDWRQITWQPHNCQYPVLSKPELQQCVAGKKVLFIGDSTNRGMMYYLIERVNDTLQEWQKAHDMKFYHNINNRNTFISYSYYPQFWISINQRPTFEEALEQLLLRSQPLENTRQTILVIGGVQWLNFNHLHIIQKVLKRSNLSNILVVIKSLGMGFHLPVDGVHSLSQAEVQNLWVENQAILNTTKQYGYEVVDTFIITMGRYKEFLQGKCGCHFHEVVKSKTSGGNSPMGMMLSKPYALGKYFNNQSNLVKLHAYAANTHSPYHVRGPINQVYSEILLSRICANERHAVRP